jgi:tetratricopeptide (TPR) repeat protein
MEVFDYNPKIIHFLTRDVDQYFQAGEAYAAESDFNNAGKYIMHGLQRDPRSSKGHRLLGEAYFGVGKYDAAGREFQAALQFHAGDAGAQRGLARVSLQQHRTDDAIAILERLIITAPDDADAYRLLSASYVMKNDTTKASMYAKKADDHTKKPAP